MYRYQALTCTSIKEIACHGIRVLNSCVSESAVLYLYLHHKDNRVKCVNDIQIRISEMVVEFISIP